MMDSSLFTQEISHPSKRNSFYQNSQILLGSSRCRRVFQNSNYRYCSQADWERNQESMISFSWLIFRGENSRANLEKHLTFFLLKYEMQMPNHAWPRKAEDHDLGHKIVQGNYFSSLASPSPPARSPAPSPRVRVFYSINFEAWICAHPQIALSRELHRNI